MRFRIRGSLPPKNPTKLRFKQGANLGVMLMLNPGGGAMVLRSVGMFLEGGRRGSSPQAHSLLQRATRRRPASEESAREGGLAVFHLSASEIAWSRKVRPHQREAIMAEETKKTGNKSQPKLVENFKKKTHFSRQEIEALCRIYRDLLSTSSVVASKAPSTAIASAPGLPTNAGKVEGLDRIVFRELVHNAFDLVTEEVLVDRIFCAFDRNNDGVIKLENWICGLSTFLRGTLEERAAFCFLVYDMNADGYITRDEMMHLLRNCLMKSPQDEDPEEGVRDLVELVLRKIDVDKDGKISQQDFLEAVTTEPLMLEALGPRRLITTHQGPGWLSIPMVRARVSLSDLPSKPYPAADLRVAEKAKAY